MLNQIDMFSRRISPSMLVALCLCALLPLFVACAEAPVEQPQSSGGGVRPEVVVLDFIEDFDKALKDDNIQDDDVRERWTNTLADHFLPVERSDHREALANMLESYASELTQEVNPGEEFLIEIRYDQPKEIQRDRDRALVQIPNGRIFWQVLRDGYLIDSDETPLSAVIGREDNALPTVRVGNNWFLSENYE